MIGARRALLGIRPGAIYWRLEFDGEVDNNGATGIDLEEVEFLVSGVDQATGGSASASSTFGGLSPASAFDDSGATRWASDFSNTWPQWIQYQFPRPVLPDQISLTVGTSRTRAPENITVQYSSNGTDFTTYDVINTGAETDWVTSVKRTFTLTP